MYARDTISRDKLVKPIDFRIINLDDQAGPGTHWVGLLIINEHAWYYDSYGIVPPVEVVQFTKNHILFYQKDQLQFKSNLCGWFVVRFAFDMLIKGLSPNQATRKGYMTEASIRRFKTLVSSGKA